jgi:hypothetical protein
MTPNEYAARHKLNPKSVRRRLRALYGKAGDGSHKHGTLWQMTPAMIAALNKPAKPRPTSPIEKIRSTFRPSCIDVLFVGESAPTAGTFFYKGDSSAFREMEKTSASILVVPLDAIAMSFSAGLRKRTAISTT